MKIASPRLQLTGPSGTPNSGYASTIISWDFELESQTNLRDVSLPLRVGVWNIKRFRTGEPVRGEKEGQ